MQKKYLWPEYSKKEIEIASKVIRSNKVNYLFGSYGKTFEKNFSKFSNTNYSLAVANGTLALDLALRAINLKPGDEVLVTSRSYVASASCISLLGGVPIFCDVDLNSQNILPDEILAKISKKTKAIICVHFSGFPCEMNIILDIAKKNRIAVIEDCAQAHGAMIGDKSVGSFGEINAWSFCNDKIMTLLGEGGMVTTNSEKHFQFISSFNNHGKNLEKYFNSSNLTEFPYIHESIGSNYRITEMQSAVGIYQLSKIKSWQQTRERNAKIIVNAVHDLDIISVPEVPREYKHGWYKLYLTLKDTKIKKSASRADILEYLNANSVPAFFGGCGEIYNEKPFKMHKPPKRLKNAAYLQKYSLMFPVHPTITKFEMKRRAKFIVSALKKFSK